MTGAVWAWLAHEKFLEDVYNQHSYQQVKEGTCAADQLNIAVIRSLFTGTVWAGSEMKSFSKTLTTNTVTNR